MLEQYCFQMNIKNGKELKNIMYYMEDFIQDVNLYLNDTNRKISKSNGNQFKIDTLKELLYDNCLNLIKKKIKFEPVIFTFTYEDNKNKTFKILSINKGEYKIEDFKHSQHTVDYKQLIVNILSGLTGLVKIKYELITEED